MNKRFAQRVLEHHDDLICLDGIFFVSPLHVVSRGYCCERLSFGVRFWAIMFPLFDAVGRTHLAWEIDRGAARKVLCYDDIDRKDVFRHFSEFLLESPRTQLTIQDFVDTWGYMSMKVKDPRHLLTFATAEVLLGRAKRASEVLSRLHEVPRESVTEEISKRKETIEQAISGDRDRALRAIDGWISSTKSKVLAGQF